MDTLALVPKMRLNLTVCNSCKEFIRGDTPSSTLLVKGILEEMGLLNVKGCRIVKDRIFWENVILGNEKCPLGDRK